MKAFFLSLMLAASAAAANLDITGWFQENGTGGTARRKIIGVAAGEAIIMDGSGFPVSRPLVVADVSDIATGIPAGSITDAMLATTVKPGVTLATTTNTTLSGEQTIDGVLTSANTVLLAGQSTQSQNGPWVTAAGAWSRPAWYANGSTTQAPQYLIVPVRLGATHSGSFWRMATAGVTIGTTSTGWAEIAQNLNSGSVSGQLPLANGGTASATAQAAKVVLGVDVYTGVADISTNVLAASRAVMYTSISAARALQLPAASGVNAGQEFILGDLSGSCSASNTITINRAGADTIDGATAVVISAAYGKLRLVSDGVSKWSLGNYLPLAGGTLTGALTLPSVILPVTTSSTNGVILAGSNPILHNYFAAGSTGHNVFYGVGSGNFTLGPGGGAADLGSFNTGIGDQTLTGLTTGQNNFGGGYQALKAVTTGSRNNGVGYTAGYQITTASLNNLFGDAAGGKIVGGDGNNCFGYVAGYELTSGQHNIHIGSYAGYGTAGANAPQTDNFGVLIGYHANRSVASGTQLSNYIGIGDNVLIDASNTVKIGATTITKNYFNGDLSLGEAATSATPSFYTYNDFTNTSNYERGVFGWSANNLLIGTQSAGTGANQNFQILRSGTTLISGTNVQATIHGDLASFADGGGDIGISASSRRFRDLWLSRNATAAGSILSTSPTAGVGYTTGSGGTVTQITSRSTGVTLNKVSGTITTDTTAITGLAGASFTVTNSACGINDVPKVVIRSGQTNKRTKAEVTAVAAGSFEITIDNLESVTAEVGAMILNFVILKGSVN